MSVPEGEADETLDEAELGPWAVENFDPEAQDEPPEDLEAEELPQEG